MKPTAPPPPKRGRPSRGGESGYPVTVRLTTLERDAYTAAAEAGGLSVAEWIRQACKAALPPRARRALVDS